MRACVASLILVGTACASTLSPSPAPSAVTRSSLALVHANVVDTTGGPTLRDQTIVIRDHRIVRVDHAGAPAGARVIDITGKFVIPGLWDMHVHVFSNEAHPNTDLSEWAFPLFVANGITGVRDMWSDPDDIALARRWNAERDAGTRIAPHVEWTSEIVDGVPPVHPNGIAVATAADARRVVDQLKASGSTFIKIYWRLSREAFFAIAGEAHREGLAFGGHVPFAVSAFDASAAGMKSIEHLTGMLESCSPYAAEYEAHLDLTPDLEAARWTAFDERACRARYPIFVEHHTWHVPTLTLMTIHLQRDESGLAKSPALAHARAQDLADWATAKPSTESPPIRRAHYERLLSIVRDMDRAGVGILAGTDLGNGFIMPGFSLHDELALLVEAGMSPLHALQAATRNPGSFFDRADIGTIAPGNVADLVILEADPLVDIRNTRRIAGVVLDGRYLDRAALDGLLRTQR